LQALIKSFYKSFLIAARKAFCYIPFNTDNSYPEIQRWHTNENAACQTSRLRGRWLQFWCPKDKRSQCPKGSAGRRGRRIKKETSMFKIIQLVLLVPCFLFAAFDFSTFRTNGISITEIVYSGRPNPTFTIHDSTDIETIIKALTPFTANTIDSSLIRIPDSTWIGCSGPWQSNLGYRGLVIPRFVIGNQTVVFRDSSYKTCSYIWDQKRTVEKLLIAILAKDSTFPISTIPDSLKLGISVESNRNYHVPAFFSFRTNGTGITISWHSINGNAIFQIINIQGKIIASFNLKAVVGSAFLDYSSLQLSSGVYILKSNLSNKANVFTILH
jgi:hypothetical protein